MPSKKLQTTRVIGLGILLLAGWVVVGLATEPTAIDSAGYDEATRTILCDCGCHPQSVHACACGRAGEMRREMWSMTQQGLSGDEIIASYVERFGQQIRVAPTAQGFNLVAWLGPPAGLLLGSIVLAFTLSRWSRRRQATVDPAPEPSSTTDGADVYHKRLREALEKME